MEGLRGRLAFLGVVALVLGWAAPALPTERLVLAYEFNLNGEAADADQVVTVAALADSTTYVIAAQPDSCRLIDITVVDADSSVTAGTITLTGTDCLGSAIACVYTFTGAGSGVKSPTTSTGLACYMGAVTSVVTGVLTGEGAGDTVTVGYTSNSVAGYVMYGTKFTRVNGEQGVNPRGYFNGPGLVTTSGVLSTTLTGDPNAFTALAVGDRLLMENGGTLPYDRYITAKGSNESVTLSIPMNISTSGVPFKWQKRYFSTNPSDQLWVTGMDRHRSVTLHMVQTSGANTGGVVYLAQCSPSGTADGFRVPATVGTVTVATTVTTGEATIATDLRLAHEAACRFSARFGTGDDGDATAPATEAIGMIVTLDER